MLKIAIVGCGKIADAHTTQIQRIKGCEIVGVCDREPLMARQLAERLPIRRYFSDVTDLLNDARPDAVHITTPPDSHFTLARVFLQAGCHVYVEKPFTLNADEARQLVALAAEKNLKITVGHDDQFRHAARRMRNLVRTGFLGDGPVHMESYYCYELGRSGYAEALLSDKQHWVRQLPGGLLHNIISHGIARIAEFLTTDTPEVIAYGYTSPFLKRLGETDLMDELRVIIAENQRSTAYFTFSSQMHPALHQFRIYGSKNGLLLDQDQETLIMLPGARRKSYLEQFLTPLALAQQYIHSSVTNVGHFLHNDFHPKAGMKYLIESFYKSILNIAPEPIAAREILLTATLMDRIFLQLHTNPYSPSDSVLIGRDTQNRSLHQTSHHKVRRGR
jgi:predicted dehydrogenase